MANVKPLNNALKIEAYAQQKCMVFCLELQSPAASAPIEDVAIPLAIVQRLHHLGRAFDGQAVKCLQTQGMYRIGFTDTQRLISELDLVSRAVSDPVTQHYLARLLPLLRATSAMPSSAIKVMPP